MIEIRQMEASDMEGFRLCLNSVIAEQCWIGTLQPWEKGGLDNGVLERWAEVAPNPIALHKSEVIGFCDITRRRGTMQHVGHLGMAVRQDFRGQGIGKRLLDYALETASVIGLWRVELEVYLTNTPAISLYRKSGFVEEGVKKRAALVQGHIVDVLAMARVQQ